MSTMIELLAYLICLELMKMTRHIPKDNYDVIPMEF